MGGTRRGKREAALGCGCLGLVLLGLLATCSAVLGDDTESTPATTVTATATSTEPAPTLTATVTATVTATPAARPTAPVPLQSVPRSTSPPRTPVPPRTTAPRPRTTAPAPPPEENDVYYGSCAEARAAGAAPLYAGEPGYRAGLDRDKDGVACES
ncbi:excalibur calcium-binding domain-containing protein [Knoellia remsis]|nr:excalibur calcium-binding domain-containing protein [Knoellia remsis]